MKRFMSLKTDIGFKFLFGQQRNSDLLMAFLNALLARNESNQIVSLVFGNTELSPLDENDKLSRLDVYVETQDGEKIDIEMQVAPHSAMAKRTLYYWAELYGRQAKRKSQYSELNRVVTINILDFKYIHSTERFHTVYHIREAHEGFALTDALEIHFVELPKFLKDINDLQAAVKDPLEKWLLLLEAGDNDDIQAVLKEGAQVDIDLDKALEELEELGKDDANWALYAARNKEIRDAIDLEQRLLRGVQEAREKALKEGRVEGRAEGRAEGRVEGEVHHARTTACKLIAMGLLNVEKIAEATGLPVEEVERLKKELSTN